MNIIVTTLMVLKKDEIEKSETGTAKTSISLFPSSLVVYPQDFARIVRLDWFRALRQLSRVPYSRLDRCDSECYLARAENSLIPARLHLLLPLSLVGRWLQTRELSVSVEFSSFSEA